MLTSSFLRNLETQLGQKLRKKIHIHRVTPVSGGSINLTARIDTGAGNFFLKMNDGFRFPQMFVKEANGLETIKNAAALSVPEIILTNDIDGQAFLVLQFIDGKRSNNFWESFGSSLAKMHRTTSSRPGFTEDNYIGSLHQSNREHNGWIDFFTEERLEKQLQLAIKNGKMNANDATMFGRLYSKIESLIPEEPPALLHGDLWNGNFITGTDGNACLIDPAIYFGHREMDLAMTKLFGGFDESFYKAYNEEYSWSPGFDERIDIHNLYPLMVHVNLFGGNYIGQVRAVLKKLS